MERSKALYALTATMLIWGFTPVATRFLVKDLPPADVLVIRYVFCAAAFAVVLTATAGWRIDPRDLPRFLGCAAAGVVGYNIANVYGFQGTPASLGGLILGTEPALIAVLAALWLGEAVSRPVALGLVLASLGTVVLLAGDVGSSAPGGSTGLLGPLLVLASAIGWSVYVVAIKPLLVRYGPVRASAFASVLGSPFILSLTSTDTLETASSLSALQWSVIAFLAVFGTVVSLFLWNYGARHVSSASAGAFIYSLPLISVLSAVVILGERITLPIIIGGALILTGVAIAQFVPRSAAPGRSIGPAKVSEIAP